jgi:hypothetical protein
MTVAAQLQDFIYQGGNAFFKAHTNEWKSDVFDLDDVSQSTSSNRLERGIVRGDQLLMDFVNRLIQFISVLFVSKDREGEGVVKKNVQSTEPLSSSKRLVDKFNQQYSSVNTPKKTVKKAKSKGLKSSIELGLGILVYGVYRIFKK